MTVAEWNSTSHFTIVNSNKVARQVSRSTGFDVVDLPRYYRDMSAMTGLPLDALIRIVDCIPFFASGERHLLLRRVIVEAFKEPRIAKWQWLIDEEVDSAIARLEGRTEVDLVSDFTDPLFAAAMARLLGIPRDNGDDLNQWAETVRYVSELLLPVRRVREMDRAASNFLSMIEPRSEGDRARRRRSLADPLAQAASGRLSEADLNAVLAALFIAGQTTAHTLANILLLLLRQPLQARQMPGDPVPRARMVEMLIRRASAPQYLLRLSRQDQTVAGQHFKAGEKVLVHIPSANGIDEAADQPITCPVTGAGAATPHFSFGSGIHHCPGAPLARMLLGTAVDRLMKTYPDMELLEHAPPLHGTDIIKSPRSLSCRLEAAPRD